MRAIVFGGTGFIGSHVVEQLHIGGNKVTAVVREFSNTMFLEKLGVDVIRVDFNNYSAIGKIIKGHDVVYNCTASAKLDTQIRLDASVEIELTRILCDLAVSHDISRFIQLSTVVIYDFRSNEPIDEAYLSIPEYPIQHLGIERERIVEQVGYKTGMTTMILRPASTIGLRDESSFFARLFSAHTNDQYPMIGNGSTRVSLVDARDVGRAMVWLGNYQKSPQDNGVYLLKGFDTTWKELKIAIDHSVGKSSNIINISDTLTDEQMNMYRLSSFALKTFTVNRIWNNAKIRNTGFQTQYSLMDAVSTSVRDLMSRDESLHHD